MSPLRRLSVVLGLLLMLSTSSSLAQTKTLKSLKDKRAAYEQEMRRRQRLQDSGKAWFAQRVLPEFQSVLSSVNSVTVTVSEPATVLPPSLGGPLTRTEVVLEARVSGWTSGYYRNHGRFSSFPTSGFAECRFKQKLWALIDANGRATRLVDGQRAITLIACATGDFSRPEYHGQRSPYNGW